MLQKCMNNVFSCETVDRGCFAFAPLVVSNLVCQRTSQLGESACHMPISYRLILLETSAAGLPGNYLYTHTSSLMFEMFQPNSMSESSLPNRLDCAALQGAFEEACAGLLDDFPLFPPYGPHVFAVRHCPTPRRLFLQECG